MAFLNKDLDGNVIKTLEGIDPPPLELESEEGISKPGGTQKCKFLQTYNTLQPSGELTVIEYHKNSHRKGLGLREL